MFLGDNRQHFVSLRLGGHAALLSLACLATPPWETRRIKCRARHASSFSHSFRDLRPLSFHNPDAGYEELHLKVFVIFLSKYSTIWKVVKGNCLF